MTAVLEHRDGFAVDDLDEATLTIRLDPAGLSAGAPPAALLVHLAEHLLGRALLAQRWPMRLRGTARGEQLCVRFVAPRAALDDAVRAGTMDRVVGLWDVSAEVLAEELAVLASEDTILPLAVRTRDRLPTDLELVRQSWAAGAPRVRLDRAPVLSAALRSAIERATGWAPARPFSGPTLTAGPERAAAYASLLRRLGRPPELFLDGEPFTAYYRPAAVLLSGLSGYRSPLFRLFRRWGCYSVRLFDFGWRRHTFTAVTTVAGVGTDAFARDLGPRAVAALRALTPGELEDALVDGVLEALEDLAALAAGPRRRAHVARLAALNSFPADPGAMGRWLLQFPALDVTALRDVVAARLSAGLPPVGAP